MATQVPAHGLGESYKRKEDARFIRGQGNYVDDVQLPGMLYGDIVRSPYAHALIKNVDISEAMKVPGVLAVITGKDLDAAGLAWMPTLSADTEAVLALDRVHFQMQEVAFVVATSRYAAADGAAAVEVDYEPLQVVVDPKKALEPDAPLLRPDKKDKQPTNQIWHWETGDREATNASFAEAEANGVVVRQEMFIPRIHPAPIETCGCVADFHKATGKLTVWMTSQAPHAVRTLLAIVAGLPEHRIRVISHLMSAVVLVTRCRSIPATCALWSRQSQRASQLNGLRTAQRTSPVPALDVTIISKLRLLQTKMEMSKRCAFILWLITARLTQRLSRRSFLRVSSTFARDRMTLKMHLLRWTQYTPIKLLVASPIDVHFESPRLRI